MTWAAARMSRQRLPWRRVEGEVPFTKGRMTPMNDCPQGLKSCANPATAAIATVQMASGVSTVRASPQLISNQIEQAYELPLKQFPLPPFWHSPHSTWCLPPHTHVQDVRM